MNKEYFENQLPKNGFLTLLWEFAK
jgi:hypothetical protein